MKGIIMTEESDFSKDQIIRDEDIKREEQRKNTLHNLFNGPLSSRKEKGVTFPDAWLC
jgi:hypothetical protein